MGSSFSAAASSGVGFTGVAVVLGASASVLALGDDLPTGWGVHRQPPAYPADRLHRFAHACGPARSSRAGRGVLMPTADIPAQRLFAPTCCIGGVSLVGFLIWQRNKGRT